MALDGIRASLAEKDCFRDLLMRLDPIELERALRTLVEALLPGSLDEEDLAGVSLDGKTPCGTLRPLERAVHLLALVDHRTGYVLSLSRVDEKTNEHKATLPLLREMVLRGRVIVGGAMFCQREVCQQIVDSGGDYLVAVKENQPALLREISLELRAAASEPKKRSSPPTDLVNGPRIEIASAR